MGTRWTVAALGVATLLAAAACGTAAGDKAGGTVQTVTLSFANPYAHLGYTPQVQAYIDAVENVSNGAIQVAVRQRWRDFEPGFEQGTVSDVAEGKVDLAWVGTRAFDVMDSTAFQALTAPMLIDSYALQQTVSDSDIPASMLAGLDVDGVVGLAVLAGGLRKPFSVDKPWVSLTDFQGKVFNSFPSHLTTAATQALGAIPDNANPDGLDQGLVDGTIDGFEKQLSTVAINGLQEQAPYVAANVNLWPETIAIIANAERLGSLTEQQRAWLTEAATEATSKAVEVLPDDAKELATLCGHGLRAGQATQAQLAELRAAFDELYASLREDPVTADFIDRIEDLKARSSAAEALIVPPECTGEAPAFPTVTPSPPAAPDDEARAIEGVYRWTLTADAVAAANYHWNPGGAWPAVMTMTLKDGRWSFWERNPKEDGPVGGGPYTVQGDVLKLIWEPTPSVMTFTFRKDDAGNLSLEPSARVDVADAFVITSQQWVRVDRAE